MPTRVQPVLIGFIAILVSLATLACDGKNLPSEPVPFEGGWLHYEEDRCFRVRPNLDTIAFECGAISAGFIDSTTWSMIADLVDELGGETKRRTPRRGDIVWHVDFLVPVGTEKQAIETAERHPRVAYANLIWGSIRVFLP